MVRSDLFALCDDLSLEVDVFEHSLDDHVGMPKVFFPVFHVVGESGDVGGVDVVFVVSHALFADFLFPVGVDVGMSTRDGFIVAVFEQYFESFFSRDLSNTGSLLLLCFDFEYEVLVNVLHMHLVVSLFA